GRLLSGRDIAPGHRKEISQCVGVDARKSNEDDWIVYVVFLDIVSIRVCGQKLRSLIEVDANSQGMGLTAGMRWHACEHLPSNFQSWRSIGCSVFSARQSKAHLAYRFESCLLLFGWHRVALNWTAVVSRSSA